MSSPVIGRARLKRDRAEQILGLESDLWYDVVEPPGEMSGDPPSDYVWLIVDGRAVHIGVAFLDIEMF